MPIPCDTCHMPQQCTYHLECRDTTEHDLDGNRINAKTKSKEVELAIAQAAYPDVHPDFTDAGWEKMAHAAIEAMRSPTEPNCDCEKCRPEIYEEDPILIYPSRATILEILFLCLIAVIIASPLIFTAIKEAR